MIEAVFVSVAQAAVGWLLGTAVEKMADGALKSAGGDIYKSGLERLRGLFDLQFYGKKKEEFSQAKQSPKTLEEFILREAENDLRFKEILEEIVTQLEEIRSGSDDKAAISDSISNSSVENSDVVNNKIELEGVKLTGTKGDVIIGGKKTEERFRRQN
jgi:hypothetical protein